MALETYPRARTALLMIDPLNDFLCEGGKLWPYLKPMAEEVNLVANQKRALLGARAAGVRVIYVPHRRTEPGDFENFLFLNPTHAASIPLRPFARGEWGGDWHPELAPAPGEIVVYEHWFQSGFANTDLDYQLRQHGIDRIVLTGQRTNACFESTGRYGAELGYHVTLLRDATAAFSREEMQATLDVNARTFAHAVCTVDDFLGAIEPA